MTSRAGAAKVLAVGVGVGWIAARAARRWLRIPTPQNEMVKAVDGFKRLHESHGTKLVMMPSDDGEPMWGYWCAQCEVGMGVRARRIGTIRLAEPGETADGERTHP